MRKLPSLLPRRFLRDEKERVASASHERARHHAPLAGPNTAPYSPGFAPCRMPRLTRHRFGSWARPSHPVSSTQTLQSPRRPSSRASPPAQRPSRSKTKKCVEALASTHFLQLNRLFHRHNCSRYLQVSQNATGGRAKQRPTYRGTSMRAQQQNTAILAALHQSLRRGRSLN